MPLYDETIINAAVYNDNDEFFGHASVTLPDLTPLTTTISGAGLAGNVEVPVIGMYDTMDLTLAFRTMTVAVVKLTTPGRHAIELRVAQQHEDPAKGILVVKAVKHKFIVVPKQRTGGTVTPAQPSNGTCVLAVRYWSTFIDGAMVSEIDPFNNIIIMNGVDYTADVRKALGK